MKETRHALVVDDERDIRELLTLTLGRMGLAVDTAASLEQAREQLARQRYDLCLTDMNLPDGSGLTLVAEIAQRFPATPVAMITAHGNVEAAVEALKAGAFDFVSKPVELPVLRGMVSHALLLQSTPAPAPSASPPGALAASENGGRLVGHSPAMAALHATVAKVARSQAPVYILGESGVGKELVARTIHEQGARAAGPFVPVNCGAIPAELMESEFFGHKKGSFTGAHADKPGLFQAAHGGTLFLDEIAELPLPMQVKLLRAIQEKTVRPVGAHAEVQVDVRILSATHKDLAEQVAASRFRHDLYYRLNVIELRVPPLRERGEDLPALARAILARLAAEQGRPVPLLADDAMAALAAHPFPGNVRELENLLERALALADGDAEVLGVADLGLPPPAARARPATAAGAAPSRGPAAPAVEAADEVEVEDDAEDDDAAPPLPGYIEELERAAITKALEDNRWNRTKAAAQLGITFRALRYRLKKLGIE